MTSLYIVIGIIIFFVLLWIVLVYEMTQSSGGYQQSACLCLSGVLAVGIFSLIMIYEVRPLIDDLINGGSLEGSDNSEKEDWLGRMMAIMLAIGVVITVRTLVESA